MKLLYTLDEAKKSKKYFKPCPFITVGYRLEQPACQCFTQTMFILHNEAASVYSHLLPVGYWVYKLY